MKRKYTARLEYDGGWWLGFVDEVPEINCQEKTIEELKNSIVEAICLVEECYKEKELLKFKWIKGKKYSYAGKNYETEILTA